LARITNNEIKNCSFDFLNTCGDLTNVNSFVFLRKGKSFNGVKVFLDQKVKNSINFLLSVLVFKWKLTMNCIRIQLNYNGNPLKLIRIPLVSVNHPIESGKKDFHPKDIN